MTAPTTLPAKAAGLYTFLADGETFTDLAGSHVVRISPDGTVEAFDLKALFDAALKTGQPFKVPTDPAIVDELEEYFS